MNISKDKLIVKFKELLIIRTQRSERPSDNDLEIGNSELDSDSDTSSVLHFGRIWILLGPTLVRSIFIPSSHQLIMLSTHKNVKIHSRNYNKVFSNHVCRLNNHWLNYIIKKLSIFPIANWGEICNLLIFINILS